MRRAWWMAVLLAAVACHRPAPVLEYGETVTYTSTASDPAPQALPPADAGTGALAEPAPAAPVRRPPPAAEPAATVVSDGGWTTTVSTGDVQGVSSSSAPPEAATAPAGDTPPSADDAPRPPAAERPGPRQWYKAKPW